MCSGNSMIDFYSISDDFTGEFLRLLIEDLQDSVVSLELSRLEEIPYSNTQDPKLLDLGCNIDFLSMLQTHDINIPKSKCTNIIGIKSTEYLRDYINSIVSVLYKRFYSVSQTGAFIYPENGRMSWHTNSNDISKGKYRLYLSYNYSIGSEFIFFKNENVRTIKEPIGWSLKVFSLDPVLYHCVKSVDRRISFGFQFDNLRIT